MTSQRYGKPALLTCLMAASYDGSLMGEPWFETQLWTEPDDPEVPLNLQVQADLYEATMQAVAERDWIEGVFSFGYAYWDNLGKGVSVRGKPAENVLIKWFDWLSETSLSRRPVISALPTNSGPSGTAITISGENFSSASEVLFGDVNADFSIVSNMAINAIVPFDLPFENTVTVINSQGGATTNEPFYVPPVATDRSSILEFTFSSAMTAQSSALTPEGPFTLEAWIQIDSVAEYDQIVNLSLGEWPTGMQYSIIGRRYSDIHPSIAFSQMDQQSNDDASIEYVSWSGSGRWAHAAGVYNNDSLFFYLDFVEVDQVTQWNENSSKPSAGPPLSGIGQIGLGNFHGKIRDVRLWDKALSPEEMLALAGQALSGEEEDLIACWPLDDGEGQTARDIGPNNLPITLGYSTNVEENDPTWLTFDVPPAELSVTIPAGNVKLVSGDVQYIAWSCQSVDSVKIELSTDNGLFWSVIATVKASPSTYIWTVPAGISSGACLIKVTDLADETVTDLCDAVFSIAEFEPGDVGGDGSVNIFDLLELLQVLAGTKDSSTSSDVNGDGSTNIFDLLSLLGILAR
ncbi:LamG-like jellyroll fold domain-containing protein [Gemmatimonadota bacterium]